MSELPDATLVAFVYDERPTLNLMRSLIRDARTWPNLSIWDKSKDALISRARSDIATMFLAQGNGDVLLMVDHDIGWEPGNLEHITRVCLDLKAVVGGVFPKRGFGIGVPIRWGDFGQYTIPDDRVVECSAVATGFIAIHRSVLEAMAPTLPMTIAGYRPFFVQRTIQREDGLWDDLSEDYDFCEKTRALGFQVFADLRPQLTHFGTHLFSMADTKFIPPDRNQPITLEVKNTGEPIEVQGFEAPLQLWVDPDDHKICGALIRGERWEPEVPEFIAAELKPDDVIVEIGAHVGYDTVQLAPRVRGYVAIEALPHLAEILRKNVELHELNYRVVVIEGAVVHDLDDRPTARMFRDGPNPGASHLLDATDSMGIEVAARHLAEARVCFGTIDILKLDVEGAEFLILEGLAARNALRDCRLIVTEYCDAQLQRVSGRTGEQFLDLLEEIGFETGVGDRSSLPKGSAYCNIVARRRE